MYDFVLDASVTIAGLSPDEKNEACLELIERSLVDGVAVPQLWTHEVVNILTIKMRRGRLTPLDRHDAIRFLCDLRLSIDATDMRSEALNSATALADEHRLTLYDAAYLELAMRLGCPLATLDNALRAAARAENVAVLPD